MSKNQKLNIILTHLEDYRKYLIDNYNQYSVKCKFSHDLGFTVGFEPGTKYVKIFHWYEDGSSFKQRSCHSFVDYEGNIWKAASWKAPAKNFPRGNVKTKDYGSIRWTGC